MHGARVFTPIGAEEYAEAAARADVSPPRERNCSWVELRFLEPFYLFFKVLQSASRVCSLYIGPQD